MNGFSSLYTKMKSLSLICLLVVAIADCSLLELRHVCKCAGASQSVANDATQWCECINPGYRCSFFQGAYECDVPTPNAQRFGQCCHEFVSKSGIAIIGMECRFVHGAC